MDIESLRTELKNNSQGHLLQFWETLSDSDKKRLHNDLKSINYAEVSRYFQQCTDDQKNAGAKVDDHLQPLPQETFGSIARAKPEDLKRYEEKGLKEVSENGVGVLLLAGGQGTRLGVPYPKGMYDVGLPSKKTLYQLQAERILKLQELGKSLTGKSGIVPWYIMTSEHTKEPTQAFFEKHSYFGLSPDNVILFEQSTLPCMTFNGEIILENPSKVARAPDGNGGLYKALKNNNILGDLENRGVKYLHVYCVDNILVKMADPVFMGFCMEKGAVCGAKVVEKAFPTEAVGVVCKVDNKFQVVEYSEITLKTAERRNPDGRLTFNAGNICNHFFTLDFLKMVVNQREDELQHHVAKKKIPNVNSQGEQIKPTEPNGIKMEKFVFDVFKFADNFAVWEVLREDEFSPLKNADTAPKDTPTTSRHALFNLHQRFVLKAGGKFVSEDGTPVPDIANTSNGTGGNVTSQKGDEQPIVCEISPLVSYAGEGLEAKVGNKKFKTPLILTAQGESTTEKVECIE